MHCNHDSLFNNYSKCVVNIALICVGIASHVSLDRHVLEIAIVYACYKH